MVLGVKSSIKTFFPDEPIHFKSEHGHISFPDIIKMIPQLSTGFSFYVNPCLNTGHIQTAYTSLNKFENVDLVHYKRVIMPIENITYNVDGDELHYDQWKGQSTVALDYVVPEYAPSDDHLQFKPASQHKPLPPRTEYLDPQLEQDLLDNDKPLVVALHGLSGGSYESYIRAFLNVITKEPYNFDAVVLNSRGCANHCITSPQLFNGLWTNDVRYLINEHIGKKWPNKRVYLIGFSLGGAILANFLGQETDRVSPQIKGAAIMGTPWDFSDSSIQLRESVIGHNVYSPVMGKNLMRLLHENIDQLTNNKVVKEYIENPAKISIERLKDFDDQFTSKLFGFNNADEYYRHASPNQRLIKVRVPTVIVSSLDDPITGSRTIPYAETKINPFVSIVTTSIGGHLGWFDWKGGRWYPSPIADLFAELNHWDVDDTSVELLPLPAEGKCWKHDRLVSCKSIVVHD